MPSCNHDCIPFVMEHIQQLQPKSVLDVGLGFGKWGHLCREYLDVWAGNWHPKEWKVHIEGVEAYAPYVSQNRHQGAIYNIINYGDAGEKVPAIGRDFDVVLAMDVIEHQEKGDALLLMEACIKKANQAAIFSIPLGLDWLNANSSYIAINHWEKHRSAWSAEELAGYEIMDSRMLPAPRGPVGVFVVKGAAE